MDKLKKLQQKGEKNYRLKILSCLDSTQSPLHELVA